MAGVPLLRLFKIMFDPMAKIYELLSIAHPTPTTGTNNTLVFTVNVLRVRAQPSRERPKSSKEIMSWKKMAPTPAAAQNERSNKTHNEIDVVVYDCCR